MITYLFTNKSKEFICKYNETIDPNKSRTNNCLKFNNYIICFVNSESSNNKIYKSIEDHLIDILPNDKYNFIISGNEEGLRIKIIEQMLKKILLDFGNTDKLGNRYCLFVNEFTVENYRIVLNKIN